MKEFAEDNFEFHVSGRQLSNLVENNAGKRRKLLVTSNSSFCHSVFKRLVPQTQKTQGLFGKELTITSVMQKVCFDTPKVTVEGQMFKFTLSGA